MYNIYEAFNSTKDGCFNKYYKGLDVKNKI